MPFDLARWRTELRDALRNPRAAMGRLGVGSAYGFVAASALLPVLNAAANGEGTLAALLALAGGVGSNLLATQLEGWKARATDPDAPRDLAVQLVEQAARGIELREALDALFKELGVMAEARAALSTEDRAWLKGALREEVGKIRRGDTTWLIGRTNVAVSGERNIGVGEIRDANEVVIGTKMIQPIINNYLQEGGIQHDEAELQRQIREYLAWVQESYGRIVLRGIERKGVPVVELELETVYVPLEAERSPRSGGKEEVPMNEILAQGTRVAVIGGPGSGKSTVLQHIAWTLSEALLRDEPEMAKARLGLYGPLLLPVYIPLGAYAAARRHAKPPATLADFITQYLREGQAALDLPADFFQRLLGGGQRVILLLDGLDEVADSHERALVREAIEQLCSGRGEVLRVVVTCRTVAYRGRTALGRGFETITVKPLSDEQVAALVVQACRALYAHDRRLQEGKSQEIIAGIRQLEQERRRRPGQQAEPLITTPLMVRMLLIVHYNYRRMPEQRVEFYHKATLAILNADYLLDEAVSQRLATLLGDQEQQLTLMTYLAYGLHRRGANQGREIEEKDVASLLQEPEAGSEARFSDEQVRALLWLTRERGTLLEERLGYVRFFHLGFQEYLVARYLGEELRSDGGIRAITTFLRQGTLLDPWWREPALLVGSYLNMVTPPQARRFLRQLAGVGEATPPTADLQFAGAEIAASSLLEWKEPDEVLRADLANYLAQLFADDTLTSVSRPQLRAAAGVALAALGDPRPAATTIDGMEFCWVPPGSFWMGSPEGDEMGLGEERPLHELTIPYGYWLARFPVTNGQWQQFLDDPEGYHDPAGRWWKGLPEQRPQTPEWSHANHPRERVNWFEALAFTRWLTARARRAGWLPEGWRIVLPSEAEWEKGTRGGVALPPFVLPKALSAGLTASSVEAIAPNPMPQRRYPWNDDPNPQRANYSESSIGMTSAVGAFAMGRSPYGCEEMGGNIWEWTRSVWDNPGFPHPIGGAEQAERENLILYNVLRVLRGGSFADDARAVRCASYYFDHPRIGLRNRGFRVAVSPPLASGPSDL